MRDRVNERTEPEKMKERGVKEETVRNTGGFRRVAERGRRVACATRTERPSCKTGSHVPENLAWRGLRFYRAACAH
jgi:hypothetical protein